MKTAKRKKSRIGECIDMSGGHKAVQELLQPQSLSQIYLWTYPEERGGKGDMVPYSKTIWRWIVAARKKGIDLRPEHFFPPLPKLAKRKAAKTATRSGAARR